MTPRVGDFDSHLPVLGAIGATVPIRRVIEYGPGLASTPAWLDRKRFPHLERLQSYEDNYGWYARIQDEIPSDARWELTLIRPGCFCYEAWPTEGMDLAFVDSSTADSRVALLVVLRGLVPLVVIHDYNTPSAYAKAAEHWPNRWVYERVLPSTAVLSDEPLPAALVEALEQLP